MADHLIHLLAEDVQVPRPWQSLVSCPVGKGGQTLGNINPFLAPKDGDHMDTVFLSEIQLRQCPAHHADSPGFQNPSGAGRATADVPHTPVSSLHILGRMSRYRRFWKNVLSIMMDCFFNWRESIIKVTSQAPPLQTPDRRTS